MSVKKKGNLSCGGSELFPSTWSGRRGEGLILIGVFGEDVAGSEEVVLVVVELEHHCAVLGEQDLVANLNFDGNDFA